MLLYRDGGPTARLYRYSRRVLLSQTQVLSIEWLIKSHSIYDAPGCDNESALHAVTSCWCCSVLPPAKVWWRHRVCHKYTGGWPLGNCPCRRNAIKTVLLDRYIANFSGVGCLTPSSSEEDTNVLSVSPPPPGGGDKTEIIMVIVGLMMMMMMISSNSISYDQKIRADSILSHFLNI